MMIYGFILKLFYLDDSFNILDDDISLDYSLMNWKISLYLTCMDYS
jgi:hypothetical protein